MKYTYKGFVLPLLLILVVAGILLAGGIWYYASSRIVPSTSVSEATSTVSIASSTLISVATTSTVAVCDQKALAQESDLGSSFDNLRMAILDKYNMSGDENGQFGFLQNDNQVYFYFGPDYGIGINYDPYKIHPSNQISLYQATSTDVLDKTKTVTPKLLMTIPDSGAVNAHLALDGVVNNILLYDLQNTGDGMKASSPTVYAYNIQNGMPMWSRSNTIIAAVSSTGIYAFEGSSTTPLTVKPSISANFMRLSLDNGTALWNVPITIGGIPSVMTFGSALYLINNNINAVVPGTGTTDIHSVDPVSGKTLWTYSSPGELDPFIVFDGNLYIDHEVNLPASTWHQNIIVLSESTGKVVSISEFPATRTELVAPIDATGGINFNPYMCDGNIYFTASLTGLDGYSETDKLNIGTGKIVILASSRG